MNKHEFNFNHLSLNLTEEEENKFSVIYHTIGEQLGEDAVYGYLTQPLTIFGGKNIVSMVNSGQIDTVYTAIVDRYKQP